MADRDAAAAPVPPPVEKTTDTVSQFVARVLNQLSLSAWLPAAALVLFAFFIVELGAALESRENQRDVSPVGAALGSMSGISLGGAFLLVVAVVVLTMVTQAFAFEAIQVLEGYWTNRLVQRLARWRCDRHRSIVRRLREREATLTRQAWNAFEQEVRRDNEERRKRGAADAFSDEVLRLTRAEVLGTAPVTPDSDEAQAKAKRLVTNWPRFAPPELIRQRAMVSRRLEDYPRDDRIMPTKLGNVLRHYEDDTRREDVRTLVQRVFEYLPLSLKIDHDEMRTRLDLYCSMVFVVGLSTVIAVVRLAPVDLAYAAGSAVVGLLGMALMYQAGVASARAYGGILVLISKHVPETQDDGGTDQAGDHDQSG